ncbi:MAG: Pyrroline-5-carboxylate reductase [uncultured Solirubrobacteraceae bacterium]|uniref:Pyrroline-5-carboxylate reductase n=1 Tax=uncultured Solirubrobacteraceae bacterium TaxID=1162706 RepID=A0A6J4RS82_9ACTN|nr:MAG: Pyrroline-5-carboxylate reductase [uncultured Solirubrobacteraceae bacterium]
MTRLGLIGSGNMARALAVGWGQTVLATDSGSGRAAALVGEVGGESLGTDNAALARRAEILVLCHKPYQLDTVAAQAGGFTGLVVSVLGGVTLAQLRTAYPEASVSAVMPNTAVEVRRGVTLLAEGSDAPQEVTELFGRLGTVVTLPETALGAGSGISGVGPAYVALFAEAWVDAGVRAGLKPADAGALVLDTLAGSAELIRARGGDTLAVRRGVTSPGGTTARGLRALTDAGLASALHAAMDATRGTS